MGARFDLKFGEQVQSGIGIGVNLVALVALVLLGRVRIEPSPHSIGDAAHEMLATQE